MLVFQVNEEREEKSGKTFACSWPDSCNSQICSTLTISTGLRLPFSEIIPMEVI